MRKLLVRFALLLILLLVVGVIVMNVHKVEELENTGPTAEASRNPYFAAERFLETRGIRVSDELHRVDPAMLGDNDVLFLSDVSFLGGDRRRAQALLDWVSRGGRLIWRLDAANRDSPLADLTGISLVDMSVRHQDDDKAAQADKDPSESLVETEIDTLTPSQQVQAQLDAREQQMASHEISILFEDDLPRLRGHFYAGDGLNYTPKAAKYPLQSLGYAKAGDRIDLMRFGLGLGQVSVLTDTSLWHNDQVGLFDHALLLATLSLNADTFYLQHYIDAPTLAELIREYALAPMLVLLLLLLFWALAQARRFGPLDVSLHEQRRSLAEHVHAVARFHQQHQQADYLLAPLRRQVVIRASRYNPQFEQLDPNAQQALIEAHSQHNGAQVVHALSRSGPYSQTEFLEIVQMLTSIRDQL